MKIIGITGGIGSGKSTASDYLRRKGFSIIDADELARSVTEKGSPALAEIRKVFGSTVFTKSGDLDRKKMAGIVFADMEKKRWLETIVTDRVYAMLKEKTDRSRDEGEGILFLDAPLLFETKVDQMVDLVWLVTADENIRVQRVSARDGMAPEEVRSRIRSQMPEEEKAARSQVILNNSGERDSLYEQIDRALRIAEKEESLD